MELMQCTGCDFIIREGKSVSALKCCPDSNYVKLNVCTPTERAFLDEIREKFHIDEDGDCVFPNETAWSMIFQEHFTKCNLSELMEKKG